MSVTNSFAQSVVHFGWWPRL